MVNNVASIHYVIDIQVLLCNNIISPSVHRPFRPSSAQLRGAIGSLCQPRGGRDRSSMTKRGRPSVAGLPCLIYDEPERAQLRPPAGRCTDGGCQGCCGGRGGRGGTSRKHCSAAGCRLLPRWLRCPPSPPRIDTWYGHLFCCECRPSDHCAPACASPGPGGAPGIATTVYTC